MVLPIIAFAAGVWLLQQQAALPPLVWAWTLAVGPGLLLVVRGPGGARRVMRQAVMLALAVHGALEAAARPGQSSWIRLRSVVAGARPRATGYVRPKGGHRRLEARAPAPVYVVERMREHLRTRIQMALADAPAAGVMAAALVNGDQQAIPPEQWQVFTRTGINHLMSISGLHVTMLSGLAFALVNFAWRLSVRLTLALPAVKAAAVAGFLVALAYALLAGFAVSAQRTVFMLAVVAAALWLGRATAASAVCRWPCWWCC